VNFNFLRGWATLKAFVVFAGLVLFLAGSSLAQTETGQISGVVTDPSGATVPKAKVTVLNAATGGARDTTTDEHGAYAEYLYGQGGSRRILENGTTNRSDSWRQG